MVKLGSCSIEFQNHSQIFSKIVPNFTVLEGILRPNFRVNFFCSEKKKKMDFSYKIELEVSSFFDEMEGSQTKGNFF